MSIAFFVGEPVDKPHSLKGEKKKGKIKQDSYSSQRICEAGVVQFSCLEPKALQKRGSAGS